MKKAVQTVLPGMPPEPPKKRQRMPLAGFKSKFGIATLDSGPRFTPREARWVAIKIPPNRLDNGEPLNGMSVIDMIANFGRLLDEMGYEGTGRTERAAIEELCKSWEIPPPEFPRPLAGHSTET